MRGRSQDGEGVNVTGFQGAARFPTGETGGRVVPLSKNRVLRRRSFVENGGGGRAGVGWQCGGTTKTGRTGAVGELSHGAAQKEIGSSGLQLRRWPSSLSLDFPASHAYPKVAVEPAPPQSSFSVGTGHLG